MKMKALLAVMTAALATPTFASETYDVDKAHSSVGFQIRHLVTMVSGRFTDFAGAIRIDREKPESSSVEFTIQAKSIDTAEPRRDDHLRSADFFDVANHPTIAFRSTAVESNGKDAFLVTGDLTLRGVTKQVTLPVRLVAEGKDPRGNEKIGFEVTGTLNRKDFGLTWNRALEAGGFLVGDEVKLQISVAADKAKPVAPPAGQ